MDTLRVLYYDVLRFQPENIELLKKTFDFVSAPDPDSDTVEVLRDIDVVFAPLGYYCGKGKIDAMPRLKAIASNTTGTPHIDTEYAKSKNIRVISLKGRNEFLGTITPTAEHAWGLILSLTRRTPWAYTSVCDGAWDRRPFGAKGMLSRMSLGIAGLGRLGKMVTAYGKCFGMEVRWFDPYVADSPVPGLIKTNTLKELVSKSDIVTIHIPLEEETKGLFNAEVFSSFKDGAYLINTSRGELIDSDELLKSLKCGRLAGAALDVIASEFDKGFAGNLKEHPLIEYARNHDNLLITPHIGGSTIDAWRLTEEHTIKLVAEAIS